MELCAAHEWTWRQSLQLNAASASLYPQQAHRLTLMRSACVMYIRLDGDKKAALMAVRTAKLSWTKLQPH